MREMPMLKLEIPRYAGNANAKADAKAKAHGP